MPLRYIGGHGMGLNYAFQTPQAPHTGASLAEFDSLQIRTITEADSVDDGEPAECSICHVEVPIGTKVTTMPCTHWYHGDCLRVWLAENRTCPMCRHALQANR